MPRSPHYTTAQTVPRATLTSRTPTHPCNLETVPPGFQPLFLSAWRWVSVCLVPLYSMLTFRSEQLMPCILTVLPNISPPDLEGLQGKNHNPHPKATRCPSPPPSTPSRTWRSMIPEASAQQASVSSQHASHLTELGAPGHVLVSPSELEASGCPFHLQPWARCPAPSR